MLHCNKNTFFFVNKIFGVRLSGVLIFSYFSLTFSYFLTCQTTSEDDNSKDELLRQSYRESSITENPS